MWLEDRIVDISLSVKGSGAKRSYPGSRAPALVLPRVKWSDTACYHGTGFIRTVMLLVTSEQLPEDSRVVSRVQIHWSYEYQ